MVSGLRAGRTSKIALILLVFLWFVISDRGRTRFDVPIVCMFGRLEVRGTRQGVKRREVAHGVACSPFLVIKRSVLVIALLLFQRSKESKESKNTEGGGVDS